MTFAFGSFAFGFGLAVETFAELACLKMSVVLGDSLPVIERPGPLKHCLNEIRMLWYQLVVIGNGLEDCAEGGNVWIEGNFVATPPGPSDSQTDQSQFPAAVQPALVCLWFSLSLETSNIHRERSLVYQRPKRSPRI